MRKVPCSFARVSSAAGIFVALLLGAGSDVIAQTSPGSASFDVETVKPGQFDPSTYGAHISRDRASYHGVAVRDLIADAYDVNLTQVTGPDWINHERYDIEARMPDGTGAAEVRRMLQDLLKRRFALALHQEKRETTVYALGVDKRGANLKPALPIPPEAETDTPLKPGERYIGEGLDRHKQTTNADGSITTDLGQNGTQVTRSGKHFAQHWERSSITMDDFARALMGMLQAAGGGLWPVVNQTGLTGAYQVSVDYKFGNLAMNAGTPEGPGPFESVGDGSLDQSLKALGLRLEIGKAPIDTYVVDHVDKPSPN